MTLKRIDPDQIPDPKVVKQIADALAGIKPSSVRLSSIANAYEYRIVNTNIASYDPSWFHTYAQFNNGPGSIQFPSVKMDTNTEAADMTKISRTYYQFLLVYSDTDTDLQAVIAEDEQSARDTVIQESLRPNVKAKDVEIVVLHSKVLKPRTVKD